MEDLGLSDVVPNKAFDQADFTALHPPIFPLLKGNWKKAGVSS